MRNIADMGHAAHWWFKPCTVLAAASLLASSAASGVQVSQQQAQNFQVGRSTYTDVVGALGEPTTNISSNGTRVAAYIYAAVQSRLQNFISYIGPLVAGYDTKSSSGTSTFDSRSALTHTHQFKAVWEATQIWPLVLRGPPLPRPNLA